MAPSDDALEVEIETDGSVSPEEALVEAMRSRGNARAYGSVPVVGTVSGTSSRNANTKHQHHGFGNEFPKHQTPVPETPEERFETTLERIVAGLSPR